MYASYSHIFGSQRCWLCINIYISYLQIWHGFHMQYMYSVWTHIYIYTVNMYRFNLTYFIFYLYYILFAGEIYFFNVYI